MAIADASGVKLDEVGTVVFGSRVHAGHIDKKVGQYISDNKDVLASKKTAYFLTCMFNDEKGDKQCAKIGDEIGIATGTYFVGAKKKVAAGDTKELDAFVEKVNGL